MRKFFFLPFFLTFFFLSEGGPVSPSLPPSGFSSPPPLRRTWALKFPILFPFSYVFPFLFSSRWPVGFPFLRCFSPSFLRRHDASPARTPASPPFFWRGAEGAPADCRFLFFCLFPAHGGPLLVLLFFFLCFPFFFLCLGRMGDGPFRKGAVFFSPFSEFFLFPPPPSSPRRRAGRKRMFNYTLPFPSFFPLFPFPSDDG